MQVQANIDTVVQYLFREADLQSVPVDSLRQFVREHPYSATGRYLLVKKLRDEKSDLLNEEIETSVLYYNNALWLQFLLENDQDAATKANAAALHSPEEAAAAAVPDMPAPTTVETVSEREKDDLLAPAATTVAASGTDDAVTATTTEVSNKEEAANEIPAPKGFQIILDKAASSGDAGLLFEPYHTIDYFASQGIKLQAEDFEKDRFGRQLKSFTEWLRSMKKIPAKTAAVEATEEETNQQQIQIMAGHSVEGREAETEAMAEVWLKQGNKQKAIAIYQKLSLQNPAKSHYFAAKIEQLKAG